MKKKLYIQTLDHMKLKQSKVMNIMHGIESFIYYNFFVFIQTLKL